MAPKPEDFGPPNLTISCIVWGSSNLEILLSSRSCSILCNLDVGIAVQTILLGVTEQGLGACINISFQHQKLRKLLSLSDELEPVMIIALGRPTENIQIVPVGSDGNTTYYRGESDIHYVPK